MGEVADDTMAEAERWADESIPCAVCRTRYLPSGYGCPACESDPEASAAQLTERFWQWRVPGRALQTLRQDLMIYTELYRPHVPAEILRLFVRLVLTHKERDRWNGRTR